MIDSKQSPPCREPWGGGKLNGREICTLDCREQNDNDNVEAPRQAAHWRLGEKRQKSQDYEVIKSNLRQAKTLGVLIAPHFHLWQVTASLGIPGMRSSACYYKKPQIVSRRRSRGLSYGCP